MRSSGGWREYLSRTARARSRTIPRNDARPAVLLRDPDFDVTVVLESHRTGRRNPSHALISPTGIGAAGGRTPLVAWPRRHRSPRKLPNPGSVGSYWKPIGGDMADKLDVKQG